MTGRKGNRHKWCIDLSNTKTGAPQGEFQLAQPDTLDSPVGYSDKVYSGRDEQSTEAKAIDIERLTVKKSWDIASAPLKQIPMNLFMMWMSGNTISIFPIMMVGMMFFNPIKGIFNQQAFNAIQGSKAPLQKFVYCLGNAGAMLLAVYKCQSMGLLPTTASDWLAFETPQQRMEWSGGGLAL